MPVSKVGTTFESCIHVWRARKRMTQQELADLVEVSRQTIIQLERNRYNPSLLVAHDIAKVFDVTINDLFTFTAKEDNSIAKSRTE
ncbi:helix-turn-helix transcriptional regulator [Candidatus Enterococcus mansonii]|uniref:Cro/CI family transcriptional regulator n=1 Tax=Candidatus Enterococcus mansonii TaxID=1834181 RepID=A0A242CII6_9ENTE|nr:helix-turn-helix transcriptional regulator [Enterococcus sp. 4G2_DIV0659]OTO09592.1 cro/CI family transcriptional regulator [Enterococcus sp. 4G2_DIV0659]